MNVERMRSAAGAGGLSAHPGWRCRSAVSSASSAWWCPTCCGCAAAAISALLPASALGGGALLLGADLVAAPCCCRPGLPIGVITASVGAPLFISLLLRQADDVDVDPMLEARALDPGRLAPLDLAWARRSAGGLLGPSSSGKSRACWSPQPTYCLPTARCGSRGGGSSLSAGAGLPGSAP